MVMDSKVRGHTCSAPQLAPGVEWPPNVAAHAQWRHRVRTLFWGCPDLARQGSSSVWLSYLLDSLSEKQTTLLQSCNKDFFFDRLLVRSVHTGVNSSSLKVPDGMMNVSHTHLSEVNSGDKIVWTLFAGHCRHLDQSMINCPSFQRPVLFTKHL